MNLLVLKDSVVRWDSGYAFGGIRVHPGNPRSRSFPVERGIGDAPRSPRPSRHPANLGFLLFHFGSVAPPPCNCNRDSTASPPSRKTFQQLPPIPTKHSAIFIFLPAVLSPQSVFLAVHPPGQKMRIKFLLYIYIINYIYIILYLYIYIYNKPSFVCFSTGGVIALILD